MPDPPRPEGLQEAVRRIVEELLRVPADQKLKYLKEAIAKLPPDIRGPAETLVLQTEAIVNHDPESARWEKIAAFAFGIVFVVVMLLIAFFVKEPTPFQLFVFRVVLALAAAGVAALIPGFLDIKSKVLRNSIRGGGALAVFVIVYLINPPQLVLRP